MQQHTNIPQISAADLFEIARRPVDDRYPEDGEFILYAMPARLNKHGKVSYWVADGTHLHRAWKPELQISTIQHQAELID